MVKTPAQDECGNELRDENGQVVLEFPKHACQLCGSDRKRVETLIDDEFVWDEDEGNFIAMGFADSFQHTGVEMCCDCNKPRTGQEENDKGEVKE